VQSAALLRTVDSWIDGSGINRRGRCLGMRRTACHSRTRLYVLMALSAESGIGDGDSFCEVCCVGICASSLRTSDFGVYAAVRTDFEFCCWTLAQKVRQIFPNDPPYVLSSSRPPILPI
jgi:hypothetical protein